MPSQFDPLAFLGPQRRASSDSGSLNFITENTATPAYQKATQFEQQDQSRETQLEADRLALAEKRLTQPTRLRKMEADTSQAEVGAKYAEPVAKAGLRQQNATAANTEMTGFYKSLDLLNNNDPEGAKEAARRSGQELPDAVVQDARLRSVITSVAKKAQDLYPERPRDQQAYIKGQMEEIQRRTTAGEPLDRIMPQQMPAGAPVPPEENRSAKNTFELLPGKGKDPTTGQPVEGMWSHNRETGERTFTAGESVSSRSGSGAKLPADVATSKWLVDNGIAPDETTAWNMVREGRANPTKLRTSIYNNALRSTFGNAKKAEEITTGAMKFIEGQQPKPGPRLQPQPSDPGAAPPGATYDRPEISQAREAIAKGADRRKVEERLKKMNVQFNSADLDL